MAALTVQVMTDNGFTPTYSTPTASDTAPLGNGHNTFAVYRNTSGTSVTVTAVIPGNTFFGLAAPDNAITVPLTTGEKWIPLRKDYDDGTGNATLTTSAQSGVTVAIVQVQ